MWKLRNLLRGRRRRMEQDLDRELRYHLDRRVEDLRTSGLSNREARRRAAIELGGFAQVQDEVRETWMPRALRDVSRDVRYGIRSLRTNVAFTVVAVASLALGIGANAAIFALFYGVLVRPLPYEDPGRLLSVALVPHDSSDGYVLTPELVAWRASTRAFEGLIAWNDEQFNLTGAGNPERIVGASVTGDFLSVLGVQPALGRSFAREDDAPGAPRTAILTHALWQRHFDADPTAVGRLVFLNDEPSTVIGVLPRDFRFPSDLRPDILVTSRLPAQPDWGAASMGMLRVIGRLREDATAERALADLSAISARHEPDMPGLLRAHHERATIGVMSLQQQIVGDTRPALVALLGAVGLLLLIACANVANLQLGRATVRRREIGLRAALGASRVRIARFLLVENLILAVLAGVAGLLVAAGLLHVLRVSPGMPLADLQDLHVGWALGGAAFMLAALAGLAVGLLPALTGGKVDLHAVLKTGAPSVVSSRGTHLRSGLVLGQVALTVVLLLAAGLFLRSLQEALAVDPGFRADGVLTARVNLPGSRYTSDAELRAFSRSLREHAGALPGVAAVATSNALPLTGYTLGTSMVIDGQPALPLEQRPMAPVLTVSPDYFRAMGIRLLDGRAFDDRDTADGPPVAIVNASFAERFFSGDALGRRLQWGASDTWTTIVGIVDDVRHRGREEPAMAELFLPESQAPAHRISLIVRTATQPLSLAASVRSAVWAVDKELPVYDLATMHERLSRSGAERSVQTLLLTAFALLAMCLAMVGIYGVVSEAVNQRTAEIGLRMALGADRGGVLRMVMRRSFVLAISGIAVGSVAGMFLLRPVASLLYGVRPTDAVTFAATGLLLLAVALLAGYVPARRAARIDPATALRCE